MPPSGSSSSSTAAAAAAAAAAGGSRFGHRGGLVSRGGEFSVETGSLIREAVEGHLHIVTDLSRHLRRTVWRNVDEMMTVAETAPQDLVAAFEIVEMQQEFCDRQLAQVRARGEPEDSARYESIVEECQARIRSRLQMQVRAFIAFLSFSHFYHRMP